jgi:hypothetical protein
MQQDKIYINNVDCFVKKNIPKENETIEDEFNLKGLLKIIQCINHYYRKPEDCPFGRGNWILDIYTKEGSIKCFKYPIKMTEEHFISYLKPLLDKLTKSTNENND